MKFIENMAVQAVAAYDVAGTPLNWTIIRERDIESLEVVFCMGVITKGAADSTGDPFWGITFFQATYDDKVIRMPGRMMPAYNYFFYPNDPAIVGAMAWADATAAAQAANEWYARARIAVHVPQKSGAYISCSAVTSGEATWTQAAANSGIAASNIFIMPRYGSFDYQLSCNYTQTLAVAGDTTFLPGTTGNLWVGSIIGAYTSLAAFTDGVALSSSTIYGQNSYCTDNVVSLLIDVAGDTVIQLPNAVQCEWPFCKAMMRKKQNHAAAVLTPVECASAINLCELLVEGGLDMPGGSSVRYMINANTADVQVLTIFADIPNREKTGGTPVAHQEAGPGGVTSGPPQVTPRVIAPAARSPMGARGGGFGRRP